jgi:hypothetical protein
MGVIGIRIPSELFERYRSLPSEERLKIYRAIQGFAIALLNGEAKNAGNAVYNISVNICSERSKGSVKDAEKLYIAVVEALKLLRELPLKKASLAKIVKELRRVLAAIALQAVDKHVEKQLKNIQKSFRKLIEMYIERREDAEEVKRILEELEKQLFQLHSYLAEKYPVF